MSEVGIVICCITVYWIVELTYKFVIDYKTLQIKDKNSCKNEKKEV